MGRSLLLRRPLSRQSRRECQSGPKSALVQQRTTRSR